MQDLAKMTNAIAQAAVGLDRVQTILDADTIIPEKPDARDAGQVKGEIAFEHVAFAYDPAAPVLRDINLTIKPGHARRRLRPDRRRQIDHPYASSRASTIRRRAACSIDGVDVTDYKLDGLRKQIGFVLQDTVLFGGTHPRQHRLRPARRDAGGNHRGREDGQRGRVHLQDAARLRLAWSASAASRFPAASASASASRAPSCATRPS